MPAKARAIDTDAPDPVEFAIQQRQADAVAPIPSVGAGADQHAQILAMVAQALERLSVRDSGANTHLAAIEKLLAHQEQTRPQENLFNPPMVSDFNPLGERDHPRPELKCQMIYAGYDLKKDGLTREEIELLNRVEPGNYRVTKADGRRIRFTVEQKRDEADRLERLSFHFPCKNPDDKANHQPMYAYLREILGEPISRENLLAQIESLKQQLAEQSRQPTA